MSNHDSSKNNNNNEYTDWFYAEGSYNIDQKPLKDFAEKFMNDLNVTSINDMNNAVEDFNWMAKRNLHRVLKSHPIYNKYSLQKTIMNRGNQEEEYRPNLSHMFKYHHYDDDDNYIPNAGAHALRNFIYHMKDGECINIKDMQPRFFEKEEDDTMLAKISAEMFMTDRCVEERDDGVDFVFGEGDDKFKITMEYLDRSSTCNRSYLYNIILDKKDDFTMSKHSCVTLKYDDECGHYAKLIDKDFILVKIAKKFKNLMEEDVSFKMSDLMGVLIYSAGLYADDRVYSVMKYTIDSYYEGAKN
jgi:hypothetical protein